MEWDWNRIASLGVAFAYLTLALAWGDPGTWLLVLAYLVIPMGCIWFSEEVGGFTGIGAHGISISTRSPGILILIVGWLLLLMPIVVAGISKLILNGE